MDQPNVGWAATEKYGVSTIPMFMIKLPGRLKLVRAPSIQDANALVAWARSSFDKLEPAEKQLAIDTAGKRVPKAHDMPRDYLYRFTDPNDGSITDLRTHTPWVDL